MNESSTRVLAEELLDKVVRTVPVVDIHTHIDPALPAARNVGEIIFYHYIVSELEAAGVSQGVLQAALTAEEKIDSFVSSASLIANTITFWCLRRVLAACGLNDDTALTKDVLLAINQKVQATSADASWPHQLLVEKHNIRKTALTLNVNEKQPSFDREIFFATLRLDDLVGGISENTLRQLMAVSGAAIGSLSAFERVLGERLTEFAGNGGKALTVGLPPEEEFHLPDRPTAEGLFECVLRGESLTLADRSRLHSHLLGFFAGLASDLHLPFQLLLGVRRPLPGSRAVSVIQPGLVTRYAPLFHKSSEARFDLLLASAAHSQELVATAKNYPNLSLSGFWWYAFSPPYIRSMLTERLLALPVVKLHAFFSDAYNVEWSAGKLALLRRELAWVLAELIVSRYLPESQAPDIARAMLSENATRLYRL